jgi:hypothetical protein
VKCISLRPDWADLVASGDKKTEFRSWSTTHRGDLLIHANKNLPKAAKGLLVSGYCIAVVNLFDVKKNKTGYSWKLNNLRYIKPIKINGQQRLFNVDDHLIQYLDIKDYESLLEYWHDLGLINLDLSKEC